MQNQKTMAAHRRTRLLQWMDKYQVNRTELAKRLEVGRAYISLLLIERAPDGTQKIRHFGEKSARSIEHKLGMVVGYLDGNDATHVASFAEWTSPDSLPDHSYALVPRQYLTMVSGVLGADLMDLPALVFTKEWLLASKVALRDDLALMDVQDDAMQDYLQKGNTVMVDRGQNTIQERSVYVIRFADELRIKRLEKTFDGGVRILSDNPVYKTEELTPEQAKSLLVVGRVLWRMG